MELQWFCKRREPEEHSLNYTVRFYTCAYLLCAVDQTHVDQRNAVSCSYLNILTEFRHLLNTERCLHLESSRRAFDLVVMAE